MPEFTREKLQLKKRGWSYRRAAKALGCSYQHLTYVLNGQRPSARLIKKVRALGPAEAAR